MDTSSYKSFLKKEYPSAYQFLKKQDRRILFFPESVPLSHKAYQEMKKLVKNLFQLKNKRTYQESIFKKNPAWVMKNNGQDSVLMAYDFHLDQGLPKLIEVNTNASAFLLVNSFYQFKNQAYKQSKEDLKKSFQAEWENFSKTKKAPQKTVLIDEEPLKQKMALEFFMYQDFFKSMNWPFEMCDSRDLKTDNQAYLYLPQREKQGEKIDFVYNRTTDFYFENHPFLAKAYKERTCVISPQPRDYFLLADKGRLCDWMTQGEPELMSIRKNLVRGGILDSKSEEEVWAKRKQYFFKAQRGYGGKMAYRGASLTRKKFCELSSIKSLWQEYIPPSRFKDSKGVEWKVDFRAYVYKDRIQQLAARCYQGQLTNFKQEGSGFARVVLY